MRRILTDNASGSRWRLFARACRVWQVRHKRTRPYTPRTNGKAERFIQRFLREWPYRRPYLTSAARTHALTQFVRYYNHQRPHASLGRRSPWTRFQEAA
ncbi:MAG: integrase core domain-containing protein [Betaproteobacteria bacterium]